MKYFVIALLTLLAIAMGFVATAQESTFLVPKNNASRTLDGDITSGALSLDVASGEGGNFPSTFPFHITIDAEILECTARSTDTLTVTRAAEGTSASVHLDGATVRLNITAQQFSDLNTAVNNIETGDVTITKTQYLTGVADPAHSEGLVFYDDDDKSLAVHQNVSGVTLQIGQEMYIYATNKTGVTITNGQLVYVDGAQGSRPTIALAKADSPSTSYVIAMATHDIANNATGYVTVFGLVREIDTASFAAGTELFLSDSVAGEYTGTAPTAPSFAISVGIVLFQDVSSGKVWVNTGPTDVLRTMVIQDLDVNTDVDAGGDVAVNGGDLTSDDATFNLVNVTPTTVNIGGAADVNIGGAAKTVAVLGDATIDETLTIEGLIDSNAVGEAINLGADGVLTSDVYIRLNNRGFMGYHGGDNSTLIESGFDKPVTIRTSATSFGNGTLAARWLTSGDLDLLFDVDLTGDIEVLGGAVEAGANTAERGILTTWDGSSNAPGTWHSASTDGSQYYFFVANDGELRVHTSLPTADTDGSPVGTSPAFGGINYHIADVASTTLTISTQSTWTKFVGFNTTGGNLQTFDSFGHVTGSLANSELTIGTGGEGAYQGMMTFSGGLASGVNQDCKYGIAVDHASPVSITSSTDATPIVVTSATAHDLDSGDSVIISGHTTNTAANGSHLVVVLTSTTFELHDMDGGDVAGSGGGAGSGGTIDTHIHGTTMSHRYLTSTNDMGGVPDAGEIDLEVGDTIYFVAMNNSSTANLVFKKAGIQLTRLSE